MSTFSYLHPADPNLNKLQNSMGYDSAGQPSVRTVVGNDPSNPIPVSLGGNDVVITGNVTIPGTVNVASSAENPVHVHIDEIGTSGILDVPWMPVSGNVHIDGGNITVQQGTNPWTVAGNVNTTVTGSVTASITNGNVYVLPNAAQTTAFDEPLAITITPEIQLDAVYGYLQDQLSNLVINGGNAMADSTTSLFSVNTGVSGSAVAQIVSRRWLRYRPGQGAMARFTATFTCDGSGNGLTNAFQQAGFISGNGSYGFGFSGSAVSGETGIGIRHSYGGANEIRTLTITTAATGTQTGTVTLDGVSYTVALTNTGNTWTTAAQIATGNVWANQWRTDQSQNTVIFTATQPGPRSGSYSFSSTGAGTLAAGTVTQNAAGITQTSVWTYKSAWNGTAVTFDPSKLNVYGVDFRYLGAGIVRFFMEDPGSGHLVLVHTQHWANTSTQPHVGNPSFKLGLVAATYPTPPASPAIITSASMMAGLQGTYQQTTFSKSWSALDTTSRSQNTMHHLLSLRNPWQKANRQNAQELLLQDLSVALQGTNPAVIYVFINAKVSTPMVFQLIPNSAALRSTTTTTIDPEVDLPVSVFTVGINGSSQFDLLPYRLTLEPGDTVSICAYSTNQITSSSVALTWAPE